MPSLSDYETFVAIIEAGNLTAASRRIGRSLQSVSRALANLEREVGTSLIRRTTRSMQPTDAGLLFYRRIKSALADIDSALVEAAERNGEVAGALRVGASSLFGPAFVVPAIAAFLRRHPAVDIELVLEDAYQDLFSAELDLAIRVGDLPDSGAMARRLGSLRQVAFAAPDYLLQRGRPTVPKDLKRHDCVIRTLSRSPQRWTFLTAGEAETVAVNARFRSGSAAACNEAVAQAIGIGIAPLWQIADLVDTGRVELLLTDHEPDPTPVHLVWPQLPRYRRARVPSLTFLGYA